MLALSAVGLGWTGRTSLQAKVPSRARTLACNEYADEVGQYFTLDDAGRLGPWYMPTTWWRSARERVEAVRHPRSEAGFAWHATHTEGRVLFAEASAHGNKVVRVNQHGPWRCLTTCGEVEQGLAYFDGATPQPQVLGYQYLRVMLAAALGFCALAPSAPSGDGPRIVCVGLGTGALPGYLAHHLVTALETDAGPAQVRAEPLLAPSQLVAVEIDPVVVRAAAQHLGCRFYVDNGEATATATAAAAEPEAKAETVAAAPATAEAVAPLPSGASEGEAGAFCVTVRDAASYVRTLRGASVAAVFLDAFDGEGETPAHLLAPVFLRECREALAPGGVLVCNLFNGATGSKAREGPLLTFLLLIGLPHSCTYSCTYAGARQRRGGRA
jgi:spermidine synthase